MSNKPDQTKKLNAQNNQRKKAAPKLARVSPSEGTSRPAEELLHELQLHQIELETQNETLRQTQLSLEESRDHYINFYDFAPVGYLTLTDKGLISEINLTGAALLGMERNKLLRQRLARFVAAEDSDRWHHHVLDVFNRDDKRSCELTFKRGNGSVFNAQLDCLRLLKEDRAPELHIVLTDITERKFSEQKILKQQERLNGLIDNAMDAIITVDAQQNIIIFNQATERIFGYAATEVIGRPLEQLIPQSFRSRHQQYVEDFGKTHISSRSMGSLGTIYGLRANGEEFPIEASISYTGTGASLNYTVILRDITERKRMESVLRESEEILRGIFEGTLDGIVLVNAKTMRHITSNSAFSRMLGYSREELTRLGVEDFHTQQDWPSILDVFEKCVRGETKIAEDVPVKRKDGSVFYADIKSEPLNFGGVDYLLGNFRDITEHKQNKLDLQQAREMIHRNVLVREVHHRIKNTLQGVATLLEQQANESPEVGAALNKAIARVRSIAVVHGLQGEEIDSQVALCDMVRAICLDLQALTPLPLILELVPHHMPVLLAEAERVPIALIVNELLFNAVKHTGTEQADQAIHIQLQGSEHEMCFIIQSAHGQLPQDFDFVERRGLGTGLSLVKSLLPPTGAHLSIANVDGGVRTELRLTFPVLMKKNT
jgi:PAS domain S-box-containing protein